MTWSHLCAEHRAQGAEPWEAQSPPCPRCPWGSWLLGQGVSPTCRLGFSNVNYSMGEEKPEPRELCWHTTHGPFTLAVLGSHK